MLRYIRCDGILRKEERLSVALPLRHCAPEQCRTQLNAYNLTDVKFFNTCLISCLGGTDFLNSAKEFVFVLILFVSQSSSHSNDLGEIFQK